ncbi:MAG: citrate/2-methylcitrate synthase [Pseudomonadota bacterium]
MFARKVIQFSAPTLARANFFSSVSTPTINQGLEGILIAETAISNVDGKKGELIYAGFLLEEVIARKSSYEDVLYLLLRKKFPTEHEGKEFSAELANRRKLSKEIFSLVDQLPNDIDYMDALRTGMSALGHEIDTAWPPTEDQTMSIVAKAPTILSQVYRKKMNLPTVQPLSNLSHVANYMHMLTGKIPVSIHDAAYIRALEVYFITTIEHGMNASTFTARVSTSTETDMLSAIVAAISTLKGPLHGGAPSEVDEMLDEIGSIENAEPWLRNAIESGNKLMGFGHRVYKTYDPRAKALQDVVATLPSDNNKQLELSRHVEEVAVRLLQEYKPGRNLYPNVEFGAAAVLRAVGLPKELYPATFAISRVGGWCTHVLEQSKKNRLMRPSAVYTGMWPAASKVEDKKVIPIAKI